jgi:carbon storage regulator CsrA
MQERVAETSLICISALRPAHGCDDSTEILFANQATKLEEENPMLVLTRHVGEEIAIDRHIRISVVEVLGGVVKIGIAAPRSVRILRQELLDDQAEWEATSDRLQDDSDSPKDSKIMEEVIRIAR